MNWWHRGFLSSVAWEYLALLDGRLGSRGEGCPRDTDLVLRCFAVGCSLLLLRCQEEAEYSFLHVNAKTVLQTTSL